MAVVSDKTGTPVDHLDKSAGDTSLKFIILLLVLALGTLLLLAGGAFYLGGKRSEHARQKTAAVGTMAPQRNRTDRLSV